MFTQILTSQATNGNSASFPSSGTFLTLALSGTFGGATVAVQFSPDDGTTWIGSSDLSFTAATVKNFQVARGMKWRLNVSGVTTTSLNAWVGLE